MQDAKDVVIYIPGSSGLQDTERIQSLENEAKSRNCAFVVVCPWKDSSDLQFFSISQLESHIDESLEKIVAQNYEHVHVIAKSFGGALALMKARPSISRMALWAPIPRIGTVDLAASPLAKVRLGELKSFDDLVISANTYATITCPILLIRGTSDQIVSEDQIRALVEMLPHAEFLPISDMAHSPANQEEADNLIRLTFDFIVGHA